jgi:hypothetical protein
MVLHFCPPQMSYRILKQSVRHFVIIHPALVSLQHLDST